MPIEFECPSCRKPIAADAALGTRVRCARCSSVVEVPSPGAGAGGVPPIETVSIGMQPARQGLAIGALVCGILGLVTCVPLIGVVGLVLGIVAVVKINGRPAEYKGMGMAVGGICTGGTSLLIFPLLISILLPSLSRARELAKRTVCSANMRGIGQGMHIYAQSDDEFNFPPDLETLLSQGTVTEKQFVCPSSNAVVGELGACYEYIAGQTEESDPTNVVMYEKVDCHDGEGANVLFQDGQVQFIKPYSRVEELVQETRDRLIGRQTKR